jgi:hypothetical protein
MRSHRRGNSTSHLISSTLLGVIILNGFALSYGQNYPVGPMNPANNPNNAPAKASPQVEAVKNKFSEWFGSRSKGPEEGEELETVEKKIGAGNPGQFDTVTITRRKKTAEEIQRDQEAAMPEDQLVEDALSQIQQAEQAKKAAPSRPPLLAQPPLTKVDIATPEVNKANPPQKLPALDNPSNPYSITAAEKKLNKTAEMIANRQYFAAEQEIKPLKEWLVQSTEAHINLYKALSKLPSAQIQSELEKQVALEFAKMRDTATYQMARIHQARNNDMEAIKLYVDVVQSQPSSQIGLQAYEHLQTMGFTQKLQLVQQ